MESWNEWKVKSNLGWQCPVCGAVNAPFIIQCPCMSTKNGAKKSIFEYKYNALHSCKNCLHYDELASYCFIKERIVTPTDVCVEWESRKL